jgi:hypothetical protein
VGIDYFVWPGLRERAVLNQHSYCLPNFNALFLKGFKFSWPFEFRDAYIRNRETGAYSFSAAFDERTFDLKYWCMTSEFLSEFPELYGDIPLYDTSPAMFGGWGVGPQGGEEWRHILALNRGTTGIQGQVVGEEESPEQLQSEGGVSMEDMELMGMDLMPHLLDTNFGEDMDRSGNGLVLDMGE